MIIRARNKCLTTLTMTNFECIALNKLKKKKNAAQRQEEENVASRVTRLTPST